MQYNDEMLDAPDEIFKKFYPSAGIEKILEKAQELSAGSTVVQVFDARAIFSREHLQLAYANAVLATIEKRSRSKSISMEMMLYAALTLQISDAIKLVGIKGSTEAVLFSNSNEAYNRIKGMLGRVGELGGTNDSALKILGVNDFQGIMNKMSLMSISD
ncbi:MAG: hypothetical protein M1360_02775 [Candidatus Marsarchaeota archaeon]|jgi:tRNA threonylcarbamoyladenosine modification (KEOPS) complex Cgi121 subunit|nr:hypothetical protein [Candidatus Marsarchaeota archaeon]MCL5418840.1 hypothetical protein [Candidatus Marsarchaeota archaeon]